MAQNKLSKELKNLQTEPVPQGEAGPKSDNLYEWEGIIRGPEGTAYEGGTFRFEMRFPAEYPFKPPKVNFLTKVISSAPIFPVLIGLSGNGDGAFFAFVPKYC
mmetsp:Transcript_43385/g.90872  ORF Transcript_43385/g.90872 Transcript_43385/m.90872 type:complete len:103 (-) Transcript_43385:151-459(-)